MCGVFEGVHGVLKRVSRVLAPVRVCSELESVRGAMARVRVRVKCFWSAVRLFAYV